MSLQSTYLRLRWPGVDTAAERATTSIGDALARTIYAVTQEPDDVAEAIVYTGAQTQELLVGAGDRTLEATAPLIRAAQKEFPRTMGFEIVESTPLGTTPALSVCLLGPTQPTAEWAEKTGSEQYPDLSPPTTALRQYLEILTHQLVPHVVRVVVRNDGTDRAVSLRTGLYARNQQWISDADHAAALAAGTHDPATYFTDDNITSSWRLPLGGTWSVGGDAPLLGADQKQPRLYLDTDAIRALDYDADHRPRKRKRLARSPAVFDAVRERPFSPKRRRRYGSFDVDPWLTVDAETLPAFLDHVPAYYDQDPWPPVPGWDRFDLTVKSVLREAPGTTPATTSDTLSPPDPIDQVDLAAPDDHMTRAVKWFATRGELHQPRTTDTATFEIFRLGTFHPVLVVTDETLTPGDLVDVVSAATRNKTTAYIVADTRKTADQITSTLSQPFRETTPDRTRLYPSTQYFKFNQQYVVYPRAAVPPEWWITPDGTIELWAESTCLGQWSQPLKATTLAESLPSCRRSDDGFVVKDPVNDRQIHVQTTEELAASWPPLPAPSVPAFLAGGFYYATVLTPTNRGFREYQHRPGWITARNPTKRYQWLTGSVLEAFCDQYTVPTDTDPLDGDQLVPRLCTWLRTIDPYGFEFELNPEYVSNRLNQKRQLRYPPIE